MRAARQHGLEPLRVAGKFVHDLGRMQNVLGGFVNFVVRLMDGRQMNSHTFLAIE